MQRMQSRIAMLAVAAVVSASAGFGALAHGYKNGTVEIRHPWMLATANKSGIVSMKIKNVSDRPERLLSASSLKAATVTLVTGRPGDALEGALVIPPRSTIELMASGPHIRLDGMTAPLAAYDRLALTLMFERSGAMPIEVMIEEAPSH